MKRKEVSFEFDQPNKQTKREETPSYTYLKEQSIDFLLVENQELYQIIDDLKVLICEFQNKDQIMEMERILKQIKIKERIRNNYLQITKTKVLNLKENSQDEGL